MKAQSGRGNGSRTAAKKAVMRKAYGGGSVSKASEKIKKASSRTKAAKDRINSHLPKRGR